MTPEARIVSALAAGIVIGAAVGASAIKQPVTEAAAGASCPLAAKPMVRLEMMFGLARARGDQVTVEEWAAFLAREVTPRFPAGLTVTDGAGQWTGNDGKLVREASKIVVVRHEPSARAYDDIEAIRTAYKKPFDQDSVMRVEARHACRSKRMRAV